MVKGTVINTNDPSVSGISQCHTDGSHTQATPQNAEGNTASDFTPTLQKFNFVNGPGNEVRLLQGLIMAQKQLRTQMRITLLLV